MSDTRSDPLRRRLCVTAAVSIWGALVSLPLALLLWSKVDLDGSEFRILNLFAFEEDMAIPAAVVAIGAGCALLAWLFEKGLPRQAGPSRETVVLDGADAAAWLAESIERARRAGFRIADEGPVHAGFVSPEVRGDKLDVHVAAEPAGLVGIVEYVRRKSEDVNRDTYGPELASYVAGRCDSAPRPLGVCPWGFVTLGFAGIGACAYIIADVVRWNSAAFALMALGYAIVAGVATPILRARERRALIGKGQVWLGLSIALLIGVTAGFGRATRWGIDLDPAAIEEGCRAADLEWDEGTCAWRRAGLVSFTGAVDETFGIPWRNSG